MTCSCSANFDSAQLFFLLVFGKLVEEEEGAWGLILSYIICGIGGNIASVIMLGKQVSWIVTSLLFRYVPFLPFFFFCLFLEFGV